MRKIVCDKCGAEIKNVSFDDDLVVEKGQYKGQILIGTEFKFGDEEEISIHYFKCDLCDCCQFKLDSLVREFMKSSES